MIIFCIPLLKRNTKMNYVDVLSWDPVNITNVSIKYREGAYDPSVAEPFTSRPTARVKPTRELLSYIEKRGDQFVPLFVSGTGGQYDSGWKNCEIFKRTDIHGEPYYFATISAVWTGYPKSLGKIGFVNK